MARNVAELLPHAFAELTLDDVAQILANVGEERESLFFERKASVNGNALSKACSAFANTSRGPGRSTSVTLVPATRYPSPINAACST